MYLILPYNVIIMGNYQSFQNLYSFNLVHHLNPTYYGPFGATPDIGGYACSPCGILIKLSEINNLIKRADVQIVRAQMSIVCLL